MPRVYRAKTYDIHIRVRPSSYHLLCEMAEAANLSKSEFLEQAILCMADRRAGGHYQEQALALESRANNAA